MFDASVAKMGSAPAGVISQDDHLKLYALFKQARHGDMPLEMDAEKEEKYKAWAALRGMSPKDAEQNYVDFTSRLLPGKPPATPLRQKTPATPLRILQDSMLNNTPVSTNTRPRALSLDSSFFVVSPLVSLQEVGERVKELAAVQQPPQPLQLFPPLQQKQRILSHLQGVGNARDLGGLRAQTHDGKPGRVKYGKIIRCGQLSEATEEDSQWLINQFQIKTLLDLRSISNTLQGPMSLHFTEHVVVTKPQRIIVSTSRARISVPLICRNVHRDVVQKNASMVKKLGLVVLVVLKRALRFLRSVLAAFPLIEMLAKPVREMERVIAGWIQTIAGYLFTHGGLSTVFSSILLQDRDNLMSSALQVASESKHHPLAFHCAFGKDRTGLVAALLLHALGVSRQDITEDFCLSHPYVFETERGAREWTYLIREFPHMNEIKHEFGASKAEHLNQALDEVERKHGSLDAYIRDVLQLDDAWKDQLRRDLVEEE